jgi:hypothetical protein
MPRLQSQREAGLSISQPAARTGTPCRRVELLDGEPGEDHPATRHDKEYCLYLIHEDSQRSESRTPKSPVTGAWYRMTETNNSQQLLSDRLLSMFQGN